jgi:hypothetical protein
LSVLVLPLPHGDDVTVRFTPQFVDGEWTVWDTERELRIVHQATWDAEAARDVAESLSGHPNYVRLWTWAEPEGDWA